MQNSYKIKSAAITLLAIILAFSAMYFIPVQATQQNNPEPKAKETNTDSLLAVQDSIRPSQIDVPEIVPVETLPSDEKAKTESLVKKDSAKTEKKPEKALTD